MMVATTEERESVVDDDILGAPVDVYRNLHADNDADALSVRSRVTETYGLVLTHSPSVIVQNPSFEVQPGGLERFKESGVKNVHAFVRGTVAECDAWPHGAETTAVTYNPEYYDSFVTRGTETPVEQAEIAHVTADGVWVVNPVLDD